MRWSRPVDELSRKQRQVLDAISGASTSPSWIQGFAGTGKTLVLAHLIERVAADNPRASLCFITFTHALKDLVATGISSRVTRRLVIQTHTEFLKQQRVYDFVFLDEAQDLSAKDLQAIKGYARNLHIAGDPDQKIYGAGASESSIRNITKPAIHRLLEIFRLTDILKRVALAILPNARLVEGNKAVKSKEVTIRIAKFRGAQEEADWVFDEARRRARPQDPSVILLTTHDGIYDFSCAIARSLSLPVPPKPQPNFQSDLRGRDYTPFNSHWEARGVPLMYVGNGYGSFSESDDRPLVYLMTYHSAKGLDFKTVFLPQVNDDLWLGNKREIEADPDIERRLMFVAITRSREDLFMSHTSARPHRLIRDLPDSVVRSIEPKRAVHQSEEFF